LASGYGKPHKDKKIRIMNGRKEQMEQVTKGSDITNVSDNDKIR